MSVAFNSGPAGVPLAKILVAFFAARARPNRDVGVGMQASSRGGITNAASRGSIGLQGLWNADRVDQELDITSAQNSKVKLMRWAG